MILLFKKGVVRCLFCWIVFNTCCPGTAWANLSRIVRRMSSNKRGYISIRSMSIDTPPE